MNVQRMHKNRPRMEDKAGACEGEGMVNGLYPKLCNVATKKQISREA